MGKLNPEIVRGIGSRIKEAREAAGISREELCRKASIKSENVLQLIEKGVYLPRAKQIAAIARATGAAEDYLVFGREPKTVLEPSRKTSALVPDAPATANTEKEPETAAEKDVPDSKDIMFNISHEAFRNARKKAGLSVAEASRRSGLSYSTVYRCETTTPAVSGHTVNVLAGTYGKSAAVFVIGDGQRKQFPSHQWNNPGYVHYNKKMLKDSREEAGYSRIKVSEEICVPALTLKDWENSKNNSRMPLEKLKKLAELYGIPVEKLLATEDPAGKKEDSSIHHADGSVPETTTSVENQEIGTTPAITPKSSTCSPAVGKKPAQELLESKGADKEPRKIPENPEKQFCKNILFYIRNSNCDEEKFDKAVGCSPDFFNEAILHDYRLPLGVSLKAARFFGKTLEEAVNDTTVIELEAEFEKIKARLQELDRMLGRKPVTMA